MKKNTLLTAAAHPDFTAGNILDSLGDGVYVTDMNRRIVYWNRAAERITGWTRDRVMGSSCRDGILCHTDKENRQLCGRDTCPLHRSITTGASSKAPLVVFAQSPEGRRIPVQVNVAPVYNDQGTIVGGVEVFRDMSRTIHDLDRARQIQRQALKWDLEDNAPLKARVHYVPSDMVGGDFYAVVQLSPSQHLFFLADVMGHGISAALHTMYLRSLFDENLKEFTDINRFLTGLNRQLHSLMHESFSFATSVCGLIDLDQNRLSLAGGTQTRLLLYRRNRPVHAVEIRGFALGMMADADYPPQVLDFTPGDTVFLFTDGAVEQTGRDGNKLGEKGLVSILDSLGYPDTRFELGEIEEAVLGLSREVGLADDVTLLEFHWPC